MFAEDEAPDPPVFPGDEAPDPPVFAGDEAPDPPVFAGDEAHLLGLVGGGDPAGLPPLLVPTVDDVEHVPEVEAQRLAEEAAVCRLVVVKQSPGGWRTGGKGGFTK